MKRKGFTLAELAVTLAVSGIVLTSIITIVVSVISFNQIRTEKTILDDELLLVENRLEDWFSKKDSASFPAPEVSEDGKELACGDKTAMFDASNDTLLLDGAVSCETAYITGISFDQNADNKNLIKCTVSYQIEKTSGTYVFTLLKRSVNTPPAAEG